MIVTSLPNRARDWAISAEITPPPRKAMERGSFRNAQKLSLVTNWGISLPARGAGRGEEPVEITA